MHGFLKICSGLVAVTFLSLLAACSSSVKINESQVLVEKPPKLSVLQVIYQTPVWGPSPGSKGSSGVMSDNDFSGFGKHMVSTAVAAFQPFAVTVAQARETGTVTQASAMVQGGSDVGRIRSVLLVTPSKARSESRYTTRDGLAVSSNNLATYEIRLTVLDLDLKKPVWQGTLETSTFLGEAHGQKSGALYDADMARKVWETILLKLKADGLV